jgi:hypothetical protein
MTDRQITKARSGNGPSSVWQILESRQGEACLRDVLHTNGLPTKLGRSRFSWSQPKKKRKEEGRKEKGKKKGFRGEKREKERENRNKRKKHNQTMKTSRTG